MGACLIWEMLAKSLVHVRVLWCAGGMDYGMSLSARREITKKEAGEYFRASKKVRGEILDRLMVEIEWSRANARRQLGQAFKRRGPARIVARRPMPPTYSYDTVKVLQQVWVVAGQPCGKYLAAVMGTTLANMESHMGSGAFGRTRPRYSPDVRTQLLTMSAATIDRLLAPFKLSMYPDGKSTTRSRRNQYTEVIPIMSRIPVIDWQPAMVAIDTVAHCGNSDEIHLKCSRNEARTPLREHFRCVSSTPCMPPACCCRIQPNQWASRIKDGDSSGVRPQRTLTQ